MSPVSFRKVCDRGARVQLPFTSSDTSTCSGALYWANHPTSRSPWATGWVSVTVIAGTRDPVENAVPWTNVALATAVRGNRAPRVAITARPAVDRVDGKCLTVIHSPPMLAVPRRGAGEDGNEKRGHTYRSVSLAIVTLWCRPPHAYGRRA